MINSEKKHKLVEIAKTEKQIAEYEKEKQDMIDRNAQIQQDLPQLEADYRQCVEDKRAKESAFEQIDIKVRQQTEQLRKEKEQIEGPLHQLSAQMTQIKADIDSKKSEISAIETRRDKIQGEIEQSQSLINSNTQKLNVAKREFGEHNESYRLIQETQELNYKKESDLKDTIRLIEQQIREQQERLHYMIRSRQDQHTRSRIPSELKKAQREGKISGFLGRLGDLGTIAEEYDRAISNGCSYLDYIVVDTVDTGEKCL